MAWQTRLVLAADPAELPLVSIRPVTARGGSEVFIYTRDESNLFARTTALLDQMGLSIMDARVMTTDDAMVLSTYHVLELEGRNSLTCARPGPGPFVNAFNVGRIDSWYGVTHDRPGSTWTEMDRSCTLAAN